MESSQIRDPAAGALIPLLYNPDNPEEIMMVFGLDDDTESWTVSDSANPFYKGRIDNRERSCGQAGFRS